MHGSLDRGKELNKFFSRFSPGTSSASSFPVPSQADICLFRLPPRPWTFLPLYVCIQPNREMVVLPLPPPPACLFAEVKWRGSRRDWNYGTLQHLSGVSLAQQKTPCFVSVPKKIHPDCFVRNSRRHKWRPRQWQTDHSLWDWRIRCPTRWSTVQEHHSALCPNHPIADCSPQTSRTRHSWHLQTSWDAAVAFSCYKAAKYIKWNLKEKFVILKLGFNLFKKLLLFPTL